MIIVNASIALKEGNGPDFVKAAQLCIDETRKEAGNTSYNLYASIDDSNKYTFVEQWESREALDTHMKSAHFQALGAAIQSLIAAPLDIKVYDAQLVE